MLNMSMVMMMMNILVLRPSLHDSPGELAPEQSAVLVFMWPQDVGTAHLSQCASCVLSPLIDVPPDNSTEMVH